METNFIFVGSEDGATLGAVVGDSEIYGDDEPTSVSLELGERLDTKLGALLSAIVGLSLGISLSTFVGRSITFSVGKAEGTFDVDGLEEEVMVGAMMVYL